MPLPAHAQPFATLFAAAGAKHGVAPLLLAAVCSRESDFGRALKPPGPQGVGDHGFGRGLMQIDARAHEEWVIENRWWDAATNIDYGAWILSVALAEFPGDERAGIAAYNCGSGNVHRALRQGLDEDHFTTGGDYSADVLRRQAQFAADPA